MNVKQTLGLALSAALMGTAIGCAPAVPTATEPTNSATQPVQALAEGTVHPDQLIQDERQILVGGKPMTVDQLRQVLPSRISKEEAAKLLVEIDPSKIVFSNEQEVQQRGRGIGRGFGRGFARGWGRGFYRGYGRGWGRGFRYYGYGGYYFPYYLYGNYYYPYYYPYYSYLTYPYLYGYGGLYYPYRYWWY